MQGSEARLRGGGGQRWEGPQAHEFPAQVSGAGHVETAQPRRVAQGTDRDQQLEGGVVPLGLGG
ncbi:hypothetical protein ACXXDK_14310 [Deinococcus sp. PESE-38]